MHLIKTQGAQGLAGGSLGILGRALHLLFPRLHCGPSRRFAVTVVACWGSPTLCACGPVPRFLLPCLISPLLSCLPYPLPSCSSSSAGFAVMRGLTRQKEGREARAGAEPLQT